MINLCKEQNFKPVLNINILHIPALGLTALPWTADSGRWRPSFFPLSLSLSLASLTDTCEVEPWTKGGKETEQVLFRKFVSHSLT